MNFGELGAALGLEEDEYRELIDLFIVSSAVDYEKIQSALSDSDLNRIVRSAHTIKGAAGNLGLCELEETARFIESEAANNRTADLPKAVQTLGTLLAKIQTERDRALI